MSYSNDFLIMTFVSLAAFPLLLLIRALEAHGRRRRRAEAGRACGGDGLTLAGCWGVSDN